MKPVLKIVPLIISGIILTGAMSGCSAPVKRGVPVSASSTNADSRQAELDRRLADIERREQLLKQPVASAAMLAAGDSLPPNAQAGQCFTKVAVEPEYETVTERKLLSEASQRLEIIPASTKAVKKRILVQEATEELVAVPATYKTVQEKILVAAATRKLVGQPAVYDTVTEKVVDQPGYTTWKKGTGAIQKIDETTGEIMCLVTVPATYKTIKKRVLKTPPGTKTIEIPAVYKTVKKRVVASPATTRSILKPAKYKTIDVTEMVSPPVEKRIPVEAEYQTVTTQKLIRDSRVEWREILCKTNMTAGKITEIQRALQKAGHNPGRIDGVIGKSTMIAVNEFQRKKKLPVDRYLNMATVRALGVSAK